MTKKEEFDLFIAKADEFIDSKYILADIKIAGLLKAIASSETLLALFKSCLTDFDYEKAKEKYFVKSRFAEGKGEFILPESSREILAFVFNILIDIDSDKINFGEFIDVYFYVDGSFSSSYGAFINSMIKPFKNTVKMLFENVLEGKIQDPIEAISEEEQKRIKEKTEEKEKQHKLEEISKKKYGESLLKLKDILKADREKTERKNLSKKDKEDMLLVIDMFSNCLDSEDKSAIGYAYASYRFMVMAKRGMFIGRIKKTQALIEDVLNGLN